MLKIGHPSRLARAKTEASIRSLKMVAERIRTLSDDANASIIARPSDEKLADAIALLQELRPAIERARASQWKLRILRGIDDLTLK